MESEFDLLREENTRLMAKITGLESEKAELEARNAELRERVAKLEEKQLENECTENKIGFFSRKGNHIVTQVI
ncbi:hypothetical protein RclHR1_12020005 [Rhizophagus clarus]|uniref:Uncharacterized protein n=1 Tax=Rhizophagus clarus TaxID=94130 RepID=A0A2Z6Q7J6_9GLOM|nr:hypothetical protein RclHR1_12020005 [Rhizophagus clarus]